MKDFSYEDEAYLERSKKIDEYNPQNEDCPLTIVIETISTCTQKCIYCPQSVVKRPFTKMDEKLVYNLLNQMAENNWHNINLSFQYINEPLLDDRLFSFLEYTKKVLPKAVITMATNGDLITEEKLDKLLHLCDEVRVTQHNKKGLKCEKVINKFIAENSDLSNKISVLRPGWLPQNWGGLITSIPTYPWECFKNSCTYKSSIIIGVDGSTALCCQDAQFKNGFGNVNEKSLKQIWEESRAKRTMLHNGEHVKNIKLCAVCTGAEAGNRYVPKKRGLFSKLFKKLIKKG